MQLSGFTPDTPTAEPTVIANTVSYLVKPETYFVTGKKHVLNPNSFTNGSAIAQTLSVDGGCRPS